MKGLILSGGQGTRLRPLTYTRAKQLLPLANKPVLFYVIDSLVVAGIHEIGIIVGDTFEEIEAVVGNGEQWGSEICISFIRQAKPLGLAHAVLTAQSFIGNERFIMCLGDNLIDESLEAHVREFASRDCAYHCQIFLSAVEKPQDFGVAELYMGEEAGIGESSSSELRIRRLIEKPAIPPSNLALVGIYCFDPHIFMAAANIQPSARGELEITDAIQWLIDSGYDVRPYILKTSWIDTGKMSDILAANRLILSHIHSSIDASAVITENSLLQGNVTVQKNAQIINSIIRGPAIIGERTTIINAYVGPFSSINHDVTIENSELEYCIVLEHCRILNVPGRIEASLIGRQTEITTSVTKPNAFKFMLGDYSKIVLPSS